MSTRLATLALSLAVAVAIACTADPPTRVRYRGDVGAAADRHGATPLFGDLDEVRAAAVDGAPDLAAWFVVETHDPAAVEAELRAAGAVEISREPAFEPAALPATSSSMSNQEPNDDGPSCPIKTPVYDARQRYRERLAVDAAWALPGGRGEGVSVADVEGEWNAAHEDLPGVRIAHVAGLRQRTAQWRAHGTAVLGVLAARDNAAGMLGLAPDVDRILTSSLGGIGAARALYEAARRLDPGDVLVVELHGPGPNHRGNGQQGFVPMEWWQPEYDAIKYATAKGVIVVEAGGNGGEDLDAPIYRGRFDRAQRDSGAILVGAGAPPDAAVPERARLAFSNYGARVDLQGWGALVATLDYGDLQGCAAHGRKYTARFGGTSSASPVVAGAALVVQGAAKRGLGARLTPSAMRMVLVETGTAQVGDQHIGPLPHVGRALTKLGLAEAPPVWRSVW